MGGGGPSPHPCPRRAPSIGRFNYFPPSRLFFLQFPFHSFFFFLFAFFFFLFDYFFFLYFIFFIFIFIRFFSRPQLFFHWFSALILFCFDFFFFFSFLSSRRHFSPFQWAVI